MLYITTITDSISKKKQSASSVEATLNIVSVEYIDDAITIWILLFLKLLRILLILFLQQLQIV